MIYVYCVLVSVDAPKRHGAIRLVFPDEFHEFIEPNDLTPEKFKEIVLPKWSADDLRHPHLREEILDALALWRKAIEELEETLRSYK